MSFFGPSAGMVAISVSPSAGKMVLNSEPYLIRDVWPKDKTDRLYRHLSNESSHYVTGFRDSTGKTIYRRAKSKPIQKGISWSISTAYGKAKSPVTMAFYANNENGQSRWGGFDFDAHDSKFADRARRFAENAFRLLLNIPGLFVIWEYSGRGWHVWAIAREFISVEKWAALLKGIAAKIGAQIGEGECEIFPPDSIRSTYGRAMRAPGSWNPSTGECSRVIYENIAPLIEDGTDPYAGDKPLSCNRRPPLLDTNDLQPWLHEKIEQVFSILRLESWSEFDIKVTSTRNEKLKKLVGHAFWYLGRQPARWLAEFQYQRKTVFTHSSLDEHLVEFDELWEGMIKRFCQELPPQAVDPFNKLATDHEKDVFRIIRSFAHKAVTDGGSDFGFSTENVGLRLGLTYQAICKMRKKFADLGIIRQTQPCLPNKRAAKFVWLLEEEP